MNNTRLVECLRTRRTRGVCAYRYFGKRERERGNRVRDAEEREFKIHFFPPKETYKESGESREDFYAELKTGDTKNVEERRSREAPHPPCALEFPTFYQNKIMQIGALALFAKY